MSEIIEMKRCAFCGGVENQCRYMVAGPMVFICDGCIFLAMDIILQSTVIKKSDGHYLNIIKETISRFSEYEPAIDLKKQGQPETPNAHRAE